MTLGVAHTPRNDIFQSSLIVSPKAKNLSALGRNIFRPCDKQ